MKKLIALAPVLLLLTLALASCGQSAEKLNNDGNDAFAAQDYAGSLVAYQQAVEESPELAEPYYNAANSFYRLEDYEQAQQGIEQVLQRGSRQAPLSEDSHESLDQASLYNLGNTFFQTEQYEMAIEVYKEALRLNPDDLEAKQNLELALRQLQQQQQEQQQDQQNQDQQDQQDQQYQDQQDQDQQKQAQQDQQDQDQQNQDQQNQDQQNQDQQDQQDQDQQGDQPQDQEQREQSGNQPQQTAGLSKEQARQLLEAAAQGTESLEEALQQMLVFPGAPPLEDW